VLERAFVANILIASFLIFSVSVYMLYMLLLAQQTMLMIAMRYARGCDKVPPEHLPLF